MASVHGHLAMAGGFRLRGLRQEVITRVQDPRHGDQRDPAVHAPTEAVVPHQPGVKPASPLHSRQTKRTPPTARHHLAGNTTGCPRQRLRQRLQRPRPAPVDRLASAAAGGDTHVEGGDLLHVRHEQRVRLQRAVAVAGAGAVVAVPEALLVAGRR